MSDETKDGGPAFPVLAYDYSAGGDIRPQPTLYDGMSLRDWFAGQVLAFCLSEFGGNADDMRQPAEAAYQIADTMLAERAKRGGK